MGAIEGGINLGAPILPATEEDVFPTHDARYGKGGYRAVDSTSALTSIPAARRDYGMLVHVRQNNLNFVWSAADNDAGGEWKIASNTVSLNSEADMLSLPAGIGTIVIRTDTNSTYVLKSNDPSNINNWVELSNNNLDGGSF